MTPAARRKASHTKAMNVQSGFMSAQHAEGYWAFQADQPESCPYPVTSREGRHWMIGYAEAEKEGV